MDLSHIGEQLIAEMVNSSPAIQDFMRGHVKLLSKNLLAVPELRLISSSRYIFDGAHKVDVCILD
jgi:hypothetical protein